MISKTILNKFQNLKNVGIIKNSTITSEVQDKTGIKIIRFYLDIQDSIIKNVNFKCFGGVVLTVCADELCSLLESKNIEEIEEINIQDLFAQIGEIEADKIDELEFVLTIIPEIIKDYNKKLEKENKKNKAE